MEKPSPGPSSRRPVLIIDDDPGNLKSISRVFAGNWQVVQAGSVREGRAILEGGQKFAAFVCDGRLVDGSGLELLALARKLHPALPLLALTAYYDDVDFTNRVQELGAEYCVKPGSPFPFARRVAIREHTVDEEVIRLLDAFASSSCLTARETEVLTLAFLDHEQEVIAEKLGITINTVRTHVQAISEKCGHRKLAEIVYEIRLALRKERART